MQYILDFFLPLLLLFLICVGQIFQLTSVDH